MSELLTNYGLFLAKTVTIVVAVMFLLSGLLASIRRGKPAEGGHITVRKLNRDFEDMKQTIRHEMMSRRERRKARSERKKRRKQEEKKARAGTAPAKKNIFVLTFKGDIGAHSVGSLRREISSILTVATPQDEVVLKLESSGGTINGYGLAASQLQRLKQKSIPLTVIVDKVAASGGYLMASVANRLLAAPFAVLGSIGVISQFPNFHRVLQKLDVDFEQITAGPYKRTLTMFGQNTEEGRKKFIEQLEEAHALFKEFVRKNRASLDIDAVATGEFWYGKRALELNLVDALQTSDDYLFAQSEKNDIYEVVYKPRETLRRKIASGIEHTISRAVALLLERQNEQVI